MHISEVYATELAKRDEGYALWHPEGSDVQFGDVGYIDHGMFVRHFNATLPVGDPTQGDVVPPSHIPMNEKDMIFTKREAFQRGVHGSQSVSTETYKAQLEGCVFSNIHDRFLILLLTREAS